MLSLHCSASVSEKSVVYTMDKLCFHSHYDISILWCTLWISYAFTALQVCQRSLWCTLWISYAFTALQCESVREVSGVITGVR